MIRSYRCPAIRSVLVRLIAGLSLICDIAQVHAQDAAWSPRARTAVDYLNKRWGSANDWDGIQPWQRFVAVDALIEYRTRTGDRRWRTKIAAAVRNHAGLSGNDDDLWAVIASVHAWQLDGDPALLAYASSTYRRIVTAYWDDHCGGGLWWNQTRTYKNAITNELLIYASTQMFFATRQEGYRDWALRGWSWFAQSSMIGDDGLVNDGLDASCRNNRQPRYTYNQGVLIGGLSDLTRLTGDARFRSIAVKTALAAKRGLSTPEGILHEPSDELGEDGPMFKGVFAYHLGHLLEDLPDGPERGELLAWAQLNAGAVWRSSASGTRAINGHWSGVSFQPSAAAQASGIDMLVAAIQR
jgi:predicted alpha-1,6-mannanase (GH76 family)